MFSKLLRWLQGYLLIQLKGQSPERFINLCSNRMVYLWDLKNVDGYYQSHITLKEYRKLKPIARKTGTIPCIKKKFGLPFLMHKYKKRKGYVTGVLLFCVILYVLSLFIWDVNILGGHTYTEEAMVKFLKNNDIYVGLQKNKINCQNLEVLIRNTYKDIGWVSAEIKGTRLIIKIEETKMPSPAVTASTPCHIIASKDCIIYSFVTRTGIPQVKIGSVVKKGDPLVSGIIDITGDNLEVVEKIPVIADADIIGKTYYEYKDTFPLNYIDKQYTGKTKTGYNFSLFLKKFNVYKPRIPYGKYDIIVDEFTLHLSDNFYLPASYSIIKYPEYTETKKKYTELEAKTIANEKLQRFLDKLIENDVLILENNVKIAIDKKSCTASGKIIVLESVKEFKTIDDSEWRITNTDESNGNDN
jgi:similar to stage IV sporulation protein